MSETRVIDDEQGGETIWGEPQRIGVSVYCATCDRQKKPRGRSAPMTVVMCDSECPGYYQEPRVGDLWPSESESDFGYPVSDWGTRLAPSVKP